MNLSYMAKAITAGLLGMIVTWLAHYGITLSPLANGDLASLVLAVVTYVVLHLAVYWIPNAPKKTV